MLSIWSRAMTPGPSGMPFNKRGIFFKHALGIGESLYTDWNATCSKKQNLSSSLFRWFRTSFDASLELIVNNDDIVAFVVCSRPRVLGETMTGINPGVGRADRKVGGRKPEKDSPSITPQSASFADVNYTRKIHNPSRFPSLTYSVHVLASPCARIH